MKLIELGNADELIMGGSTSGCECLADDKRR